MLTVKTLDLDCVVKIYKEHLVNDFPPTEHKPLEMITDLMKQNQYLCYGLYEKDQLLAYAFFFKAIEHTDILIDYFAVCEEFRNQGYGSKFLALLKTQLIEFNSIIFEVESGKSAVNDEERAICKKRLAFYRRNGLQDTGLKVMLIGVDMLILSLSVAQNPSDETLVAALDAIYDEMFGKEFHKQHIIVGERDC